MSRKWFQSPYLLLLTAACLWGGNFVAGRALVPVIPPFMLALLRWSLALLVTLPFWGGEFWRNRSLLLQHWRQITVLALTGIAGFNTLLYIAVQYTSSINASLMNSATPLLIVLLSLGMLGERIRWSALPGMLLSVAGVLWIITRGSWTAFIGFRFNPGDLWMIVAIACWAFYTVGMRKYTRGLPPQALFIALVSVGCAALLPFAAVEYVVRAPVIVWTPALLAGLGFIGIFASVLALTAWNAAVAILGPARCSGFLNFIPVFSALFAILFTSETLHLYHGAGALLIMSGVYWMNKRLSAAPRNPQLEKIES